MIGCFTCKHFNEQNRTFWYFSIAITSITENFRNLSKFTIFPNSRRKMGTPGSGGETTSSNLGEREQNQQLQLAGTKQIQGKGRGEGGAKVGFALFGAVNRAINFCILQWLPLDAKCLSLFQFNVLVGRLYCREKQGYIYTNTLLIQFQISCLFL